MTVKNLLDNLYSGFSIKNQTFKEDIPEQSRTSSAEIITITDCTFEGHFVFPKVSLRSLTFTNCRLKSILLQHTQIALLTIEDCILEGDLTIDKINQGIITIKENKRLRNINFKNIDTRLVTIQNNETIENINFENSPHNSAIPELIINDNPFKTLNVSAKCSLMNLTNFTANTIELNMQVAQISIQKIDVTSNFVSNGESLNIIEISNSRINQIEINSNVAGRLIVNGSNSSKIKLSKQVVGVEFNRSKENPATDSIIGVFDMSDISCGELTASSSTFEEIILNGSKIPEGKLKFNFLTISKRLLIENIKFSKAEFHNVDLENCEVRFVNSSLSGSELINVQWPLNYELYEYEKDIESKPHKEKLKTLWPLKESYRQLKVLSLAQQNKIDAVSFQKQELKIYWKIVNEDFWTLWKRSKREAIKTSGNWLILGTHKAASDFGLNIWKPLKGLLFVHLILFNFFIYYNGFGHFTICGIDWPFTWKMVSLYFQTLIPTHPFILDKIYVLGFWNVLMRIFSGYFIFYFITASRKFHQ